jgi:hypothetical protein
MAASPFAFDGLGASASSAIRINRCETIRRARGGWRNVAVPRCRRRWRRDIDRLMPCRQRWCARGHRMDRACDSAGLRTKKQGAFQKGREAMAIFEGVDRNRNIMIAVAVVVVVLVIIYLYTAGHLSGSLRRHIHPRLVVFAYRHGCGRWPSGIMRTARQPTAMRRRARLPWQRSLKAGGGSSLWQRRRRSSMHRIA